VTTKKSTSDNDTPKGFLRLVNRKSRKELISEGKLQVKKQKTPRIQPGESLSDFRRLNAGRLKLTSRRVDTEIPLRMGGRMNQEVPIKKKKKKPKNKQEDDDIEGEERKRKRMYFFITLIMLMKDGRARKEREASLQILTLT